MLKGLGLDIHLGIYALRTGSVGNRSADDMVNTLVPAKKSVISSIRQRLLALEYAEEVEFDSIEIEPVMVYSKEGKRVAFLRHKWDTIALVVVDSMENGERIIQELSIPQSKLETNDDDGTTWLRFQLPSEENLALDALRIATTYE